MNPLHKELIQELKSVMDKQIFQDFPKTHHVMQETEVLAWYLVLERPEFTSSIYDYMLWIRKVRKVLYPECNYIIKRKKLLNGSISLKICPWRSILDI